MSYLDLPRLHFAGLFFADPSTINNETGNFNRNVKLADDDGAYHPGSDVGGASWNPLGLARFFFRECTVLGAVDGKGAWIGEGGDPVVGASLDTSSPDATIKGPQGDLDFAKLVDLDPDQQMRSEVWGAAIQLSLSDGSRFGGRVSVPQLRELHFTRAKVDRAFGSLGASGMFLCSMPSPDWSIAAGSSPLLAALREASPHGLAISFVTDLYWHRPRIRKNGFEFGYGRVHGSIAPLRPGETAQTLYGRRVGAFKKADAAEGPDPTKDNPQPIPPAVGDNYRAAYAVEDNGILSVDLGMGVPLAVEDPGDPSNRTPPAISGKPYVETGYTVGVVTEAGFAPLKNGNLTFADKYYQLDSIRRSFTLWRNSGVFSIRLAEGESAALQSGWLGVRVGAGLALLESSSLWMQIGEATRRIELPLTQPLRVPVLLVDWGRPKAGAVPPTLSVSVSGQTTVEGGPLSTDFSLSYDPPQSDPTGATSLTITGHRDRIALDDVRAPLDSQIYLLNPSNEETWQIADRASPLPRQPIALSLLVWNPYAGPEKPGWNDVKDIMESYARLYPGMAEKVDLASLDKVTTFAAQIRERMSASVDQPDYMPVTRDLAPSKVQAIVKAMDSILGSRSA